MRKQLKHDGYMGTWQVSNDREQALARFLPYLHLYLRDCLLLYMEYMYMEGTQAEKGSITKKSLSFAALGSLVRGCLLRGRDAPLFPVFSGLD